MKRLPILLAYVNAKKAMLEVEVDQELDVPQMEELAGCILRTLVDRGACIQNIMEYLRTASTDEPIPVPAPVVITGGRG